MNKYIILLALPVPVLALLAYYVSSYVHTKMILLTPAPGKQIAELPDLQVKEAEFDPEVVTLLSAVDVKRPVPTEPRRPVSLEKPERPPTYRVTFTYVGERRNYAIINGMLLKEGDPVSQYERVVKITREGVLLSGKWGERWLPVVE